MNNVEKLIQLSISIPLAIKVITLDKEKFDARYAGNAYFSVLNQVQTEMENDFAKIKQELFHKHGIILQKQSDTKHKWMKQNKSGTIEYSKNQLKDMTTKTIEQYLFNVNINKITPINKEWKVKDIPPPDIS